MTEKRMDAFVQAADAGRGRVGCWRVEGGRHESNHHLADGSRNVGALVASLIGLLALAGECLAQAGAQVDDQHRHAAREAPQRELVVGTKETPPFAMKSADGTWQGVSIELWRRVADAAGLRYRFAEEADVQGLLTGVVEGRFDAAVGALTVTGPRLRMMDFAQPFYTTGLGIAVARGAPGWWPVVRTFTSFGFFQAVLTLMGLAMTAGLLIWLIERRHNDMFAGGVKRGLASGVWWSTHAMTQRTPADIAPQTLPGRAIAIVWMVGSIIAIAVFTAAVTSALTVRHLEGKVRGTADLASARVGTVAGTATEDTLTRLRVNYRTFATPQEGLRAVRDDAIDAFVYDKPLLAWLIRQGFASSLEMLDAGLDVQNYAFAVPDGSPLRRSIDRAVADAIASPWWRETTFRYLGAH